ncbi:MAG: leucyl aminopeptidase [Bacteroidota bacterium]
MTRITAEKGTIKTVVADVAATFLFEDEKVFSAQLQALSRVTGEKVLPEPWSSLAGKERQTLLLFPRGLRTPRLMLVGLGKQADFSPERVRRAAAAAAKATLGSGLRSVAFLVPDAETTVRLASSPRENAWEIFGQAATEGILLGLYRYDKYLTSSRKNFVPPERFRIVSESPARSRSIATGIALGSAVGDGTNLARDLENAPGNELYPETLAAAARRVGRQSGFRVRVLDEKRIRALKMGGLIGVAAGSRRPPRFIIMEYRGGKPRSKTVVLVGKGVTFDSGGISIKPSQGMAEMKMDMSGAAAVIGTMKAAAALRLPVHLIGLVPATENLPGGAALKPGDILRHHNGMTSEIDNTDAEGRLILADALSYAGRYTPDLLLDLATLTGAVVVALGHIATGMMGNDREAMKELTEAGERTYERVWELPLFEEYEKLIKSDVADVKNTGGRWAGTITAALFLKKFVGSCNWVHLDIAGTAIMEEASDYTPRGGSGVGVRLLIDFLRHRYGRQHHS